MKYNIYFLVLMIILFFLPIYLFVDEIMPEYQLFETSLTIYIIFIYGILHGMALMNEIYGIYIKNMMIELEILKQNENEIYEEIEKIIENPKNS